MRGCDNFCSFCVVPYTRGRERSRDPEGVLREVEASVQSGHTQITLLGQNVNSYRHGDWDFARLILAVAEVPGVQRVRFTSPTPEGLSWRVAGCRRRPSEHLQAYPPAPAVRQ